jgi:serralysin
MATNISSPLLLEIDDVPASILTDYSLQIGQTAQGRLTSYTDQDWFAIPLKAGQTYTFAVIGTGTNPLRDTYLYLRDAQGGLVSSDNDSGPYTSSFITYTALTDATYYLAVENNWLASRQFDPAQYGLSAFLGLKSNFDILMGAGAINSYDSWNISSSTPVITYGFRESAPDYSVIGSDISSFSRLSSAQMSAVHLALELWSDVANVKFAAVNQSGYTNNATILIGNYFDSTDGAGAFVYGPGSVASSSFAGDVWLNKAGSISETNAGLGTYSFETIVHELGHVIGLTHPGDYNARPGLTFSYSSSAQFLQDSQQYSIMSYFNSSATAQGVTVNNVTSPLILDIVAIQDIYGANFTTRTNDTVYGFNSNAGDIFNFKINISPQLCIWDAGGQDTLDCSGYNQDQVIDLREGYFSDVGGFKSNISIALGVNLENAIGGSGNDQISGNLSNNFLTGGKGSDVIDGGFGIDKAIYSGLLSDYTIRVFSGTTSVIDKTANRDGADTLTNVERLSFTDTNVALDSGRGQNAGSAYRLYKAAFNRTPDAEGLGFWIKSLDNGNSLNNVSQCFIGSPEFQRIYGANSSDTTFLTNIYSNVLGRNYDQSGYDFWLNGLKNGLQRDSLLSQFFESVENCANVAPLIGQGIQYKEWVG